MVMVMMVVAAVCRELAEKHQALLQRLDKESKDNKRLSMDRDQLMWRLAQDGMPEQPLPPTPGAVRRAATFPVPTRSAPGTPSLTRRGVDICTPGYRPLSQSDFCKFGPEHFIRDDSDEEW